MNNFRRKDAWDRRDLANQLATQREHPRHHSNGDEQRFRHTKETEKCHMADHGGEEGYKKNNDENKPAKIKGKSSYLVSFTKGMPHDYATGLLKNPLHFQYFVRAIDSGDPRDFRDTPLGPDAVSGSARNCHAPDKGWRSEKAKTGGKDPHDSCKSGPVSLRAWESQSAGLSYELEGPDAQAVTMPPAPRLGSAELTAEMAEVYCQALLRDIPFNALTSGVMELGSNPGDISSDHILEGFDTEKDDVELYLKHTEKLRDLDWFKGSVPDVDLKLDIREATRRCFRTDPTPATAFRGITKGDDVGPYLSQFLLVGNAGLGNEGVKPSDGYINYGAITADQRVRVAEQNLDYMQTWDEWMDVQEAANLGGLESYENAPLKRRFIYTPRDLATYVHYDALYEAYLNACLIMLGQGVAFDPGIPFQEDDNRDHQQGFAHFGGPHILSLVTEVATRALKAVRFQKYNIHRRCRPEVLAARIHKADDLIHMAPELGTMTEKMADILTHVAKANVDKDDARPDDNYLLPMAFCEGSPMHPAYGAGHATVAGACVTILKAFFDHGAHLNFVQPDECAELKIQKEVQKIFDEVAPGAKIHPSNLAYVSVQGGSKLDAVPVLNGNNEIAHLTVEGELNKLASNISIGRNWAGVHYFTDYYESLLMGEQIAIGILEEQKLMFGENYSMTVPLFNGDSLRI